MLALSAALLLFQAAPSARLAVAADQAFFPTPVGAAPKPVVEAATAPAPARPPLVSEIPSDVSSPAGGSMTGLVLSVGVLGALAAAAWLARRRRTSVGRLVQVLETTSLGPKRSLVLATLGERTLLLGASEAGITMLACVNGTLEMESAGAGLPRLSEVRPPSEPAEPEKESLRLASLFAGAEAAGGGRSWWRGRPSVPKAATARVAPSFEACLDETPDDQQLRAALAVGLGGKVQ
jgi:flagellar biogenesis protein FliO